MIMNIVSFVFYTLGILALIEIGLRLFVSYYMKQELDEVEDKSLEDRIILGRVEELNGTFYVYNMKNDAFVGQGKTAKDFEDMSDRIGKQVVVMDGEPEAFDKLANTDGIKEYKVDIK